MSILRSSIIILITLILISSIQGKLLFEDGYTVSTIIDGNKLGINPHSVLSRSGPYDDLVILDSSRNAFFTVSFPISKDSEVKRLSGNGAAGYSDGDFSAAMFNKPRSFAVDLKGNVYVADKNNRVIRKISRSGVSTIAGGYTRKTGYIDGPAQNASFSDDFELVFVPQICALLIPDHGSKVVRQIHLKTEDCAGDTNSGSGRGCSSTYNAFKAKLRLRRFYVKNSTITLDIYGSYLDVDGLCISCALGMIIGLTARPYIARYEGSKTLFFNKTWKHCLIKLGKQVKILYFDIRNALASSTLYLSVKKFILLGLSQISLMFRNNFVDARISNGHLVSLLDFDNNASNSESRQSDMFANDFTENLFSLGGQLELPTTKIDENRSSDYHCLSNSHGRLDCMIHANLMGFVEATAKGNEAEERVFPGLGLVKRR